MSAPAPAPAVVAETDRLLLRRWREADRAPFAALNGDPETMRHFPAPLTRAESDATMDRFEAWIEQDGLGFWAVELKAAGALIGAAGLKRVAFAAPFAPAVEIGWRFAREHWGRGYATEAANAALDVGFERFGLDEVVSFTAVPNVPSQRVMERIGMVREEGGDFLHPAVEAGHPLELHVLYRIPRARWAELRAGGGAAPPA